MENERPARADRASVLLGRGAIDGPAANDRRGQRVVSAGGRRGRAQHHRLHPDAAMGEQCSQDVDGHFRDLVTLHELRRDVAVCNLVGDAAEGSSGSKFEAKSLGAVVPTTGVTTRRRGRSTRQARIVSSTADFLAEHGHDPRRDRDREPHLTVNGLNANPRHLRAPLRQSPATPPPDWSQTAG